MPFILKKAAMKLRDSSTYIPLPGMRGDIGPRGEQGEDGADGVSPAVSFTTITGGHTMTVTDKDHPSGQSINIMDGSGGSGTSDYDDLTDKPSINNVTLSGNKTAAQLGLGTYTKPSGGIPASDLASAVQSKLDNTVAVSDTQPTATENKLWVDTDAGTGASYQIPTVAEMEAADAANAANISALQNRFPTTLYNDFNALENVYQPIIFRLNPNSQHAPNTAAFVCIQYASSANYAVQLAFRSGSTDLFMRAKASGTWGAWKSLTLS